MDSSLSVATVFAFLVGLEDGLDDGGAMVEANNEDGCSPVEAVRANGCAFGRARTVGVNCCSLVEVSSGLHR